jgi:hypothetical protein
LTPITKLTWVVQRGDLLRSSFLNMFKIGMGVFDVRGRERGLFDGGCCLQRSNSDVSWDEFEEMSMEDLTC